MGNTTTTVGLHDEEVCILVLIIILLFYRFTNLGTALSIAAIAGIVVGTCITITIVMAICSGVCAAGATPSASSGHSITTIPAATATSTY